MEQLKTFPWTEDFTSIYHWLWKDEQKNKKDDSLLYLQKEMKGEAGTMILGSYYRKAYIDNLFQQILSGQKRIEEIKDELLTEELQRRIIKIQEEKEIAL